MLSPPPPLSPVRSRTSPSAQSRLACFYSHRVSPLASFASTYPFIYSTDAGDLGGKTGSIIAGVTAIAIVVTYFYVPELKGRQPIEVDKMFELALKAKVFSKWSSNEDREACAQEKALFLKKHGSIRQIPWKQIDMEQIGYRLFILVKTKKNAFKD